MSAIQRARRERERAGEPAVPRPRAVIWHDLECGSYTADLPLWRELAGAASTASVLDVGAGTGRVTLDLAARGHRVTALDLDPELLAALRGRAARAAGASVQTLCADARAFALARDFTLCLIPMQTIQLLGGAAGRLEFLARARKHLAPGGLLACAIATDIEPFDCAAGDLGPSPEIARVDGAIYLSRATRVQVARDSVRIERERSVIAASERSAASSTPPVHERDVVELDRVGVSQLQREGRRAGLSAVGVRAIAATEEHTGSVAVMFGA
jgi:SAM-dependent methyltransferase